MGETVILPCNTTESSGVEWTQNASYGQIGYIYVNGSITGHPNILLHFSVISTSEGEYSLRIYNVQPAYSGLYVCYEANGRRIIGYHLVAISMYSSHYI